MPKSEARRGPCPVSDSEADPLGIAHMSPVGGEPLRFGPGGEPSSERRQKPPMEPTVGSAPRLGDHEEPIVRSAPRPGDHEEPTVRSAPRPGDHEEPTVRSAPRPGDHEVPIVFYPPLSQQEETAGSIGHDLPIRDTSALIEAEHIRENGSAKAAREVRVDAPESPSREGVNWSKETGAILAAELDRQRREAIRAAREALDAAETDAKRLQLLEANSAKAAVSAGQLRKALQELGEWGLWERLLQDPELNSNMEAWQAAHDFARIIEVMRPDEIDSGSSEPLLAAIARLRKQIDFVEEHAHSGGWLEIAEIYRGAARRIRWKVTVALAAAMADMGAGGGSFTAKIVLAALTGAGVGSLTTAVLDEIHDRASVRATERTPSGRVRKAQAELIRPIDALITVLDRRASDIQLEEGELAVIRTVHLVAEFRAISLGQRVAEYNHVQPNTDFFWIKRPLYMKALKWTRELLSDVLEMTAMQDYRHAADVLARLNGAVSDLNMNAPPRNLPC